MNIFSKIAPNHHATLIEGDFETMRAELVGVLEKKFDIESQGNPDFQVRSYDTLGIDEARELREAASFRPSREGNKIFIISFDAIGIDAQHALLKLFEEPTAATHFFLVAPHTTRLLPTLRSRLMIVPSEGKRAPTKEAKAFLKALPGERLKLIENIVEGRDRARAGALIAGLEEVLANNLPVSAPALTELERAREYLPDRASSVKLLMENLALVLPVI